MRYPAPPGGGVFFPVQLCPPVPGPFGYSRLNGNTRSATDCHRRSVQRRRMKPPRLHRVQHNLVQRIAHALHQLLPGHVAQRRSPSPRQSLSFPRRAAASGPLRPATENKPGRRVPHPASRCRSRTSPAVAAPQCRPGLRPLRRRHAAPRWPWLPPAPPVPASSFVFPCRRMRVPAPARLASAPVKRRGAAAALVINRPDPAPRQSRKTRNKRQRAVHRRATAPAHAAAAGSSVPETSLEKKAWGSAEPRGLSRPFDR